MQHRFLFFSLLVSLVSSVAAGPIHIGTLDPAYREYLRQFAPRYARIRQYKAKEAAEQMKQPGNSCLNYDITTAQMPNSTLPPPSPGLSVWHIALGRGTQVSPSLIRGYTSYQLTGVELYMPIAQSQCLCRPNPGRCRCKFIQHFLSSNHRASEHKYPATICHNDSSSIIRSLSHGRPTRSAIRPPLFSRCNYPNLQPCHRPRQGQSSRNK